MDALPRPATIEDLKMLIRALNEAHAQYLLIGGYALYAHGYHRATEDVDILIPGKRDAGETIRRVLMSLPDKAAAEINLDWIEQGENVRIVDAFVVDVLMNACGETYESLQQYRESVDLDGVPVATLNIEGLIKTKQSARAKDIQDRLILEQALKQLKRDK